MNNHINTAMMILKYLYFLSLVNAKLSKKSCSTLTSAFSSQSSLLQELKLNGNELTDLGLKELCTGLCNQNCKLRKLE